MCSDSECLDNTPLPTRSVPQPEREQRRAHVILSQRRATVAQIPEQNAGSDRKVSEHTCIAVCCILGCMAADSPKAVTMDMWASELEQWNKVAWSDESSFLSHYVDGQVPVCHWRTHGTRMHYGKAASQWMQCDALGDVLLENLGSCYSYGCCFETFHLPKPCCRPFIPLIETIFLNGGGIYTLQKWFRTGLKSTTKNYVTTITSVTNVLTLIKCFMKAKNTHCWLLVLHRQSPGRLSPTFSLYFIPLLLTSSFAAVIITTATRGWHPPRMGSSRLCNITVSWNDESWNNTDYDFLGATLLQRYQIRQSKKHRSLSVTAAKHIQTHTHSKSCYLDWEHWDDSCK